MTTAKRKTTARRNLNNARAVQAKRAHGPRVGRRSPVLSTAQKDRMSRDTFAFPKQRKEPLNDARHVRNAVARFDQVKGVSNADRDAAWRRIRSAARKFGVHIEARGWRQLMKGGRTGRKRS